MKCYRSIHEFLESYRDEDDTPSWVPLLFLTLGDLMAAVQVEQSDLDAIATNLASVGATLTSEIADLEAKVAAGQPLTPADLTGLKAAQSTLDALAVPASTPVPDPTPSPVADPTPPAAVDPSSVPPAAPTV